jgi:hypothetical protein
MSFAALAFNNNGILGGIDGSKHLQRGGQLGVALRLRDISRPLLNWLQQRSLLNLPLSKLCSDIEKNGLES